MAATAMASKGTLNGRIAIVTGASGEIGRSIAIALAAAGARVAVSYRSGKEAAEELTASIEREHGGGAAVAIRADVSVESEVAALFDAASARLGGAAVSILVNNAGVIPHSYPTIQATSVDDWDKTFAANTRGVFLACREATRRMETGGRIVNITSSTVASVPPGYGAYVASKAAVEGMTKVLAKELAGRGITANCIAPGPVATQMFYAGKTDQAIAAAASSCPLRRLGQPRDIAAMVLFVVSDEGEWLNGQVVRLNGGLIV